MASGLCLLALTQEGERAVKGRAAGGGTGRSGLGHCLGGSLYKIILQFRPVRVYGTRGTFAPVLWYRPQDRYTPRSGMFSSASLKRLVKFAMQIATVSSTICPSS